MDLLATLKSKIDALQDGDYMPGLKAVLLHIDTSFRHLARGQEKDDDTAYTDAIYRTNQAFEGSIKEAYRVLAGKDPSRKTPNEIEKYLEQHKSFRERVLKQFTIYRVEWRNPSTHDHKLDFDESEAFLAIVSVCAFACLLLDQIAEKLSFVQAQAQAESQRAAVTAHLSTNSDSTLLARAVDVVKQFSVTAVSSASPTSRQSELQYTGALHGFISSIAPDLSVATEEQLVAGKPFRADMILSKGDDRVLVEIRRSVHRSQLVMAQLEHAMLISGIKSAILLMTSDLSSELCSEEREVPSVGGKVIVLRGKKI